MEKRKTRLRKKNDAEDISSEIQEAGEAPIEAQKGKKKGKKKKRLDSEMDESGGGHQQQPSLTSLHQLSPSIAVICTIKATRRLH